MADRTATTATHQHQLRLTHTPQHTTATATVSALPGIRRVRVRLSSTRLTPSVPVTSLSIPTMGRKRIRAHANPFSDDMALSAAHSRTATRSAGRSRLTHLRVALCLAPRLSAVPHLRMQCCGLSTTPPSSPPLPPLSGRVSLLPTSDAASAACWVTLCSTPAATTSAACFLTV